MYGKRVVAAWAVRVVQVKVVTAQRLHGAVTCRGNCNPYRTELPLDRGIQTLQN